MARIRTIKPEFWDDEKLSELPIPARLLFIGCWNFADDFGIMPESIKWIKAKVFPYDSLRDNEVKQWIDTLVKNRMLIPFAYGDKGYYIIRRFRSHQIIDKRYEKSTLPTDVVAEILSRIEEKSITQETHSDHIVTTSPDMECKGEERNGGDIEKISDEIPPTPQLSKPDIPPKKQKKAIQKIFRESEFFEKERLAAALFGTRYQEADLDYYHEAMLNWSDGKQAKKADWLATARSWMNKDLMEGKFVTKGQKIIENGTKHRTSNGVNKPSSGAEQLVEKFKSQFN